MQFVRNLASWNMISLPKSVGGWEIRYLPRLSLALASKSLWRALFGKNLWSEVIRKKYLHGMDSAFWLRQNKHTNRTCSIFWKHLLDVVFVVKSWVIWKVGDGNRAIVGRDPFVGCVGNYKLSHELMVHLQSLNIHTLTHISSKSSNIRTGLGDWLTANELDLSGDMKKEWEFFIQNIRKNGVSLFETGDRLVCSWNFKTGEVNAKLAYDSLVYK